MRTDELLKTSVLRIQIAPPLSGQAAPDKWYRYWSYDDKPDHAPGRTFYTAHVFAYPPEGRHFSSRDDFNEVFSEIVRFDELELTDPSGDAYLNRLRHLALHIGMPVRITGTDDAPPADPSLIKEIRQLDEARVTRFRESVRDFEVEALGWDFPFFEYDEDDMGPMSAHQLDLPFDLLRRAYRWDDGYCLYGHPEDIAFNDFPEIGGFIEWIKEGRAIHRLVKARYGDTLRPLDEWYLSDALYHMEKHGDPDDYRRLKAFADTPDPDTDIQKPSGN